MQLCVSQLGKSLTEELTTPTSSSKKTKKRRPQAAALNLNLKSDAPPLLVLASPLLVLALPLLVLASPLLLETPASVR